MKNIRKITAAVILIITAYTGVAQAYQHYGEHHPNIGGLLPTVVVQNSAFDPLDGVLAYDYYDGYLTNISVTGSVNTAVTGEYELTYSVVNSSNDVKTLQRSVTVIPAGSFAQVTATGRTGPHNIITLDASYLNTLATNLTYIEPVAIGVDGIECHFKLIERKWDKPNYTNCVPTVPPTEAEWDDAKTKEFWHDLYLTIMPRRDRWLKLMVSTGGVTNEYVYGLAGDPGVQFHSDLFDKDYYRLSREVDDPQTCGEQFTNAYAHGLSFWAKADLPTLRKMGSRALASTYYYMSDSYDSAKKSELYGFYSTERSFLKRASKSSGSDSNWAKIEKIWDHTLSRGMNCSYRRSYEIFFAEVKISNYMHNFRRILPRLRSDYNPERIYIGCSNSGYFYDYINDTSRTNSVNDGTNTYFSFEWHKGHFPKMFSAFPDIGSHWPGYSQYPRINEIFDEKDAAKTYDVHRSLHKLAIDNKIEAAIFDKCKFTGKLKNGEWGGFALPFYAMWYNYDGFDYLNNGAYFKDDWDGDGLSNADEKIYGCDPFNADTDDDGIFDKYEVDYGLDPNDPSDADADADGDHVSNFDEINLTLAWQYTMMDTNGISPALDINDASDGNGDDDQDLFPFWFEIRTRLNTTDIHVKKDSRKGAFYWWLDAAQPLFKMVAMDVYIMNLSATDQDDDGVNNKTEIAYGLNPCDAADATEDWDSDGIVNSNEIANGTAPVGDYSEGPRFDRLLVREPLHALQAINAAPLHASVAAPAAGQQYMFAKLSGPAWLSIADNGILSGRPGVGDVGLNTWQVQVHDDSGRTNTAALYIRVLAPLDIPGMQLSSGGSNIANRAAICGVTDFGAISSDDYVERMFTITNGGFADLVISNITVGGSGFSIPVQPALDIPFQGTENFCIRFQPAAAAPLGTATGRLEIVSNDPDAPWYVLDLTGYVNPNAAFSPVSVSSCELWLDAADIDGDGQQENLGESVLTNGNVLTVWKDKSGHTNDAAALAPEYRPTLAPNRLGNHATVNFDGNDDNIVFSRISDIRTVFWVIREEPPNANAENFLLGDPSTFHFHRGGALHFWGGYTATAIRYGRNYLNGSPVDGSDTPVPSNQFCVISVVTTNDVQASTFSKDRGDSGRSWDGDLAELIIYSKPLSELEVNAVHRYIENKWHLQTPVPEDYNSWIGGYAVGSATNRTDDPDNDGLSNLAEYAMGTQPDQANNPCLRICRNRHAPHRFSVVYPRRKHHAGLGLHYILESSTNLLGSSWQTNTTVRTGTGDESGRIESVTNVPIDTIRSTRFYRVRIRADR
jgi:hypothetical protein